MKSAVVISIAALAAAAPTLLDPTAIVHDLGLDALTGGEGAQTHEESAQTPGQQGVVGFAALPGELGDDLQNALQGFTITQVASHKKLRNGPLALASMLQKFNLTLPDGLREACGGPWSSGGSQPWEHNHPKPSESPEPSVLPEPTQTPVPSYTPEPEPSETPEPAPSETPEPSVSPEPTSSVFIPTPQSSSSPSPAPSSQSPSPVQPSSSSTPSPSSSSLLVSSSSSSETPTPTPSSSETPTPTPTPSSSATPTPSSSATPTPTPSSSASPSPSPSSTQPSTPNSTGGVEADPERYDQAYLSPVQIGTPGQTLMLDFDTGSSDLWVFSTGLTSSQQTGHSVYDHQASSSSQELNGQTWAIQYGDNSRASGNVYADTVVVGGISATSQAVEAATSISSSFTQDVDSDGLLGLSFGTINQVTPTKQKTWFENIAPTLPNKLFTVTLKRGAPGHYDFGFIDQSRYTGNIDYAPVDNSKGYWQFTAGNAYAGSTNLGAIGPAVPDTGSSLILTTDSIAAAYYQGGVGSYNETYGGYVVPCTGVNAPTKPLPDFSIDINGVRHTTPGQYLAYAPIEANLCYGGVQQAVGVPFTIVGDVFLKSQFVVFDINEPRVGFAPQSSTS